MHIPCCIAVAEMGLTQSANTNATIFGSPRGKVFKILSLALPSGILQRSEIAVWLDKAFWLEIWETEESNGHKTHVCFVTVSEVKKNQSGYIGPFRSVGLEKACIAGCTP